MSPSWVCCARPSHREFYAAFVALPGVTGQGGPSEGSALRQGAQGELTGGTSRPGLPAFPAGLDRPGLDVLPSPQGHSLESWSARRDSGVATEGKRGLSWGFEERLHRW